MHDDSKPSLYATVSKGSDHRHLVIEGPNSSEKRLILLESGKEVFLTAGTRYEVGEKADQLISAWGKEAFRYRKQGDRVFESLPITVALALKLGYTAVYEGYTKVPLRTWRGVTTAKNSGTYEYAFGPTCIYVQAAIPPGMFTELPTEPVKLASFFSEVLAYRKSVGPEGKFLLDGDLF